MGPRVQDTHPRSGWRRGPALVAAGVLGILCGKMMGILLLTDLPLFLRGYFIPVSGIVVIATALAAQPSVSWSRLGISTGRLLRRSRLTLAAAVALLVALAVFFVRGAGNEGGQALVVIGWPRSYPVWQCQADHTLENPDECWSGRSVPLLGLALSYLGFLGGVGASIGLRLEAPTVFPDHLDSGYLDFDLDLEREPDGTYRVKVRTAERLDAECGFSLTAELLDLTAPSLAGTRRGASGGARYGTAQDPEKIGRTLFDLVFQGKVLSGFRTSVRSAQEGKLRGVRLLLRLSGVPELADLPWEYLYDAEVKGFLARSNRTPVVRYLPVSEPARRVEVEPPVLVLLMVAVPRDYPLARAKAEAESLRKVLKPLIKRGEIELEIVPPTLEALQRRLRVGKPVHVFHFVGHGLFGETAAQGELVFVNESGGGQHVSAESFADLLKDSLSLRMAVLNACSGACASGDDVFTGTAQRLVERGGVPAVIAMSSKVKDETAYRFAGSFYQALADHLPIDACIGEARKALAAKNNPEWGTPVLYLRAADGQIFAGSQGGSA